MVALLLVRVGVLFNLKLKDMAKVYKNDKNFLIIQMTGAEASSLGFGMEVTGCLNSIVCGTCNSSIEHKDIYYLAGINEVLCEDCLNDYIKKLREENPEGPHIEYGLSVGWAVYYPPVYSPDYNDNKKHMSLDKVIQLADMHMYREKKAYKAAMKTNTSQNDESR
jgi:hypothetical protein